MLQEACNDSDCTTQMHSNMLCGRVRTSRVAARSPRPACGETSRGRGIACRVCVCVCVCVCVRASVSVCVCKDLCVRTLPVRQYDRDGDVSKVCCIQSDTHLHSSSTLHYSVVSGGQPCNHRPCACTEAAVMRAQRVTCAV